MDPTQTVSLVDNVTEQDLLLRAAASAIPHQFDKCTYNLGYLRQQISLCLDCAEPRGICGACAVSCHGEHVQIELFPKRNFRCDCPTRAMRRPCELSAVGSGKPKEKEEVNEFNTYNHNYRDGGKFCRCDSHYDATHERETMVQCLACEDWFHESCLNLRERILPLDEAPPATGDTKDNNAEATETTEKVWDYENSDDEEDDPSIPPALIPASDYDAFVCGECLVQSPMLLKWAGSKGARMVVRDDSQGEWYVYAGGKVLPTDKEKDGSEAKEEANSGTNLESSAAVGEKRTRDEMEGVLPAASTSRTSDEPPAKKVRTEASTTVACNAPIAPDPPVAALLGRIKNVKGPYMEGEGLHGAGDIFFTPGWRDRWCRCKDCAFQLASRPYLEEEEETYELPDDPDAGLSLEDLGMKALSKLPRDQAIEGIRAFQAMSAEFSAYLAPFAQEGKVVTEADVNAFFEARRQEGKR